MGEQTQQVVGGCDRGDKRERIITRKPCHGGHER